MNNQQLINPFGGNKIIIQEYVLTAGVWTAVTAVENSTAFDLGQLSTEGYDSNTSEDIIKNSAGGTAYSRFEVAPFTEGIMMERGLTKRDYLRYGVINKFHLQYQYQGIVNGQHQEEFSIGQIVPQDNNSFPSGATSYKYKFNKIQMEVATTILTAAITALEVCFTPDLIIRTAGDVIIAAGQFDKLVATNVS